MIFIASLVLLLIIKLRFPKGKSIHRVSYYYYHHFSLSPISAWRNILVKLCSSGYKQKDIYIYIYI